VCKQFNREKDICMEDNLLVMVAPSIPPYVAKNLPGLDLSPEGIAQEVVRAYNAGANMVHLHVWDDRGQPTTNLEAFKKTLRLIHEQCDIIIEGSTGGINSLTVAERCVSLQTDVEMASLNPGSVNYDAGVYINSPEDIQFWASEMKERNIKADNAIFEPGMIANTMALAEAGMLTQPLFFSFVLGQRGAFPATPKNLFFLSELVPAGSYWMAAAHDRQDLTFGVLSMTLGGHVRAGFEDNPYYSDGEPALSNAQLIERLVGVARQLGREPATPAIVRQILKLAPRPEIQAPDYLQA
jgi:3-keto-5-aminohexanoate cleavage enzyme